MGVVAIVQEFCTPPEARTWHGKVADFVPYDLRTPTMARCRETYWNPDDPILRGKAWGVGWALNVGAFEKRLVGSLEALRPPGAVPAKGALPPTWAATLLGTGGRSAGGARGG